MLFTITPILLLAIIDSSISVKVRFDNYKVYRLTPHNEEALRVLKGLEEAAFSAYNFWSSVGPVELPVDVMVAPDRENELLQMVGALGMDSELLMSNVQEHVDAQERPSARNDGFGWTGYHTLAEINQWLRDLAAEYPQVTLIEGGTSFEGRTIYGVKVSYSPDNVNRSVFLESHIHAREWITSAVETYILNELLTSTNSTIRNLAEYHDWYIFPVFNPDGLEYTHTTNRMWRKTVVTHSILCTGADPNRNWDYYWNHGGTSGSPCTETFRGPAPFSEPSCRTMADYISTIGEQLVAYISFHSYSQLLLIPYGYTNEHLENYDLIYEVGVKAIESLSRRYGTQYRVGTVYDTIYPASGSSSDWVKGTFKTPIVYTYELRDLGQYGFLLPPDQILPTAEETLDSFITIFEEYYKAIGTK